VNASAGGGSRDANAALDDATAIAPIGREPAGILQRVLDDIERRAGARFQPATRPDQPS